MKLLKSFLMSCACFSLFIAVCSAQDVNYDLNSNLPIDAKIIKGKLDNGITYYIRYNKEPEKRAEFRLVENAGAILEDKDQNGLAHFCEHMAFNGTKNFPDKGMLNYLERIGIKFGVNLNAGTSWDETVYEISAVPVEKTENIDTCLQILFELACNVSYENEEIDKERGVIVEEWRARRNADLRMSEEWFKKVFYNSKYAETNLIGDTVTLNHFQYDVIKRFYKDWYRPDLQAIIAVGDFDVKAMEEKIKKVFSQIPKRDSERERKIFEIPQHTNTLVSIESDKEAQNTTVFVFYKHPLSFVQTVSDYRKQISAQLYSEMINNRLKELTLKETPPFVFGQSEYTNFIGPLKVYMSVAVPKNDQEEIALKTLLEENQRVKQHGFAITEFERAKASLLKRIENLYNERDKTRSESYAREYMGNFSLLSKDPVPGIEYEYGLYKKFIPEITTDEVNNLAKEWMTDDNMVVVITAPDKEDVKLPAEKDVLDMIASVNASTIEPYVDKVSDKPLFSKTLTPSKVDKTINNKSFESVEWKLKNGARVILKSTDFKDDQVLFTSYSLGGYSLYPVEDNMSAKFTTDIITESGISEFSQTELDKMLSGKIVSVSPWISEIQEGLSGNCSPQDFETMLQLINLYFTSPRKDKEAFSSVINKNISIIENKSVNPDAVFQDSIQVIMSQSSPFERPLTKELLGEVDFKKVHYIYNQRFGDPSNFTFFFVGKLDMKAIKPLIEKYIGGLPVVSRNETWKDLNIDPPKGIVEKIVSLDMNVPKSTVYISFTGDCEYNFKNRMYLLALNDILQMTILETVREDESGSYSPYISSFCSHYPKETYESDIFIECAPEKAEKLSKIVFDEIEKIKKNGPAEDKLNKFKENRLKERAERLKENKFWLNTLKNYDINKENPEEFLEFENLVKGLTVETLKEAANKFYKSDNYIKIVAMPKK